MAVGKGSMERASKAVVKPAVDAAEVKVEAVTSEKEVKQEEKIEAKKAEVKKAEARKTSNQKKVPAKKKPAQKKSAAVKDSSVIAATSAQVMEKIVYQSSSQVLEREAKPNESFYVGDDMPIYFL